MQSNKEEVDGCTVLHSKHLKELLKELLMVDENLGLGYSRSLVGGILEGSSSTLEFPDIDINATFSLGEGMVTVQKARKSGSFLFEIKVNKERLKEVEDKIIDMQLHGLEGFENRDKVIPNTKKSFVEVGGETYLSGHTCRWQLQGVIKAMEELGFEMDRASAAGAKAGLLNGITNEMTYDTMVCRRGFLKASSIRNVVREVFEDSMKKYGSDVIDKGLEMVTCFLPPKGIQVDYTAGFSIPMEEIPEESLKWKKRSGPWPTEALKRQIISKGVILVPKAFKTDKDKHDKSRRWRLQFSEKVLISHEFYGIDPQKVLSTLKDIKIGILLKNGTSQYDLKSYFLKQALFWAMSGLAKKYHPCRATFKIDEKELLVESLVELQKAYENCNLPDFFAEKFNHLHRSQDRRSDLKLIAEDIQTVINNLNEELDNLKEKRKKFTEVHKKIVLENFRKFDVSNLSGKLSVATDKVTDFIVGEMMTSARGLLTCERENIQAFLEYILDQVSEICK